MPVCVMEAWAMGVPVIGSSRQGVCELVQHEVTGLIVERNLASVAKAMGCVVSDASLSCRLQQGAPNFRERLSRGRFYNAVEQALGYNE
jgi:glycosyltransferase involved in cell wall biosynthesis